MEDIILAMIDAVAELGSLDASSLTFGAGRPVAMNILGQVWDYLALVGIGLSLIYFLLEMNQKLALEGRDLNLKSFFAPFLKLMVSIAVLATGAKIVGALLSLNDSFINAANNALGDLSHYSDPATVDLRNSIKDIVEAHGILYSLALIIPLFACYVISMALCLVWWFKAIVYKLEVLFRVSITPLALCDVYSGQHSNAIRYLKGFLVLGVYAGSMILLPRIGITVGANEIVTAAQELTADTSAGNIFGLIKALMMLTFVVPFAALSCSNLARTAAKEALGA